MIFLSFEIAARKIYTVRPVAFWMDKILEKENRKLLAPKHHPVRQLVSKSMKDSYMEEFLPFSTSPAFLDDYISKNGSIRRGKIMEDLDALAGAIAYKHVDTFTEGPPVTLVTAAVGRLDMMMPNHIEDMKISGHVAFVGTSSMEVFVKIDAMGHMLASEKPAMDPQGCPPEDFLAKPKKNTVLFASFTMVALDSATCKSTQVNPLVTSTAEERILFLYAENAKSRKKEAAAADLHKTPPTEEERIILHELYMKYNRNESKLHGDLIPQSVQAPEGTIWMSDTVMQSVMLMQPQNRNIHNKVFGGYLLRCAFELAHATAAIFVQGDVKMLSLDESSFCKPVPVGSVLKLDSQVTYSQLSDAKLQVSVVANVQDVERATCDRTNTFHFTFGSASKVVPRILPKTYAEGMLYLEGKRRIEKGSMAKAFMLDLIQSSTQ
ncbi:HotDog domain-containing protein [Gongronella butleri]|nr:HotDog domain-containing protein [Gongronella butleri]